MENNIENKAKFFAQYWMQPVLHRKDFPQEATRVSSNVQLNHDNWYAELKNLSDISDEDAIEVAKLIFSHKDFTVKKRTDRDKRYGMIHLESEIDDISNIFHVAIGNDGRILANSHFLRTETDDSASYVMSIGKNHRQQKPIPHIAIVDFLRSKGYLLPWMGLSTEELKSRNWAVTTNLKTE